MLIWRLVLAGACDVADRAIVAAARKAKRIAWTVHYWVALR